MVAPQQTGASTAKLKLKQLGSKITPADLLEIAATADEMLAQVRESMLRPHPRKNPPEFSTTQLAALCSIDKSRVNYVAGKGELPLGQLQGRGRPRTFTLAETRQWILAEAGIPRRPEGQRGKVVVVSNFKGGSTKTTTAMTMAQGLTLRGRRVLIVDLDPQASLTTLCGLLPDAEVDESQTVMPFIYGDQPDLRYAVQSTYWDGMDLIPGAPALFAAEFVIPHEVASNPSFAFWDILGHGLRDLAADYDVVLLDTPPSLSYLTINALYAADGMLMPLPPNALDFASATQFWNLFSDLATSISQRSVDKSFDFVNILLTKVNTQDASSAIVREWVIKTYTDKVLSVEIPLTMVTSATAMEFGTVYDVTKWEGAAKTYTRARDAYDHLVQIMDQKLINLWYQDAEPITKPAATQEVKT